MKDRLHPFTSNARGVAMLEFVLMLPFIWTVLALSFSFGVAFLERQRAMVAVREVALRHEDDEFPDSVIQEVEADTLEARSLRSEFTYESGSGSCPRDGEAVNDAAARGALEPIFQFVEQVSSSRSYRVQATARELSSPLTAPAVHTMCYAIDGGTWTSAETGGAFGLIKKAVGNVLGEIGSALFRN
ncbi:MAG: TadE/TadG family type IV pilus assembly protein [Vicinamibacterales bacterium]